MCVCVCVKTLPAVPDTDRYANAGCVLVLCGQEGRTGLWSVVGGGGRREVGVCGRGLGLMTLL